MKYFFLSKQITKTKKYNYKIFMYNSQQIQSNISYICLLKWLLMFKFNSIRKENDERFQNNNKIMEHIYVLETIIKCQCNVFIYSTLKTRWLTQKHLLLLFSWSMFCCISENKFSRHLLTFDYADAKSEATCKLYTCFQQ